MNIKTRLTCAAFGLALALSAPAANAQSAARTPQEEANLHTVMEFYRTVFEPEIVANAKNYIGDDYIEHNPNAGQGLAGFTEMFGKRFKPKPIKATLEKRPDVVMVENDLVMLIFKMPRPDPADASKTYDLWWYDMFRVKNGRIIEHWDAAMKRPPGAPHPLGG